MVNWTAVLKTIGVLIVMVATMVWVCMNFAIANAIFLGLTLILSVFMICGALYGLYAWFDSE